VSALEAEERADLALLEVAPDVIGAESQREPVGIPGDDSPRDFYLLELDSRVSGIAVIAGSINRPELRSDHPSLQSLEIGVAGCALAQIVGIDVTARDRIFPNAPGQIVVSVDEWSLSEYSFGSREIAIVGGGQGRLRVKGSCGDEGVED